MFLPFPKPDLSSDAPLFLCITHTLTPPQRLHTQTATKTGKDMSPVRAIGSRDTQQRHGSLSLCSHSPPQAPIFTPPDKERKGGGGKLTRRKIEAMAFSHFLPLFFLGCLI